jgi:DNA-directed RNA polymerase subunit RPC12/RpoP
MTFDFYVCPKCHYTIFVKEDTSNNGNNNTRYNGYREYKKKLEYVSKILSDIEKLSIY